MKFFRLFPLIFIALAASACGKAEQSFSINEDNTQQEASIDEQTSYDNRQEASASEETDAKQESFYIEEISDDIKERIVGLSYPDYRQNDIDFDSLRYLHMLHYDFEGNIKEGEMICNEAIADDLIDIFSQLYEAEYPIEKIRLIDEYDADDEKSMRDNNSSAFCYRKIAGSQNLSKHSLGMAVDINTLYNPCVKKQDDGSLYIQPETAEKYADRTYDCPYYINHDDLCYQLFIQHGFQWGGDWDNPKDYQHFEK